MGLVAEYAPAALDWQLFDFLPLFEQLNNRAELYAALRVVIQCATPKKVIPMDSKYVLRGLEHGVHMQQPLWCVTTVGAVAREHLWCAALYAL